MIRKSVLILLGTGCVAAGAAGIVLPGLPATPFLLLAAALYVRSSPRLYEKLLANKVLGPFIRTYREKRGMTLPAKLAAIGTMWTMITVSLFTVDAAWFRLALPAAGLIGTLVMGWLIRTVD